jgi:hypothetical protein
MSAQATLATVHPLPDNDPQPITPALAGTTHLDSVRTGPMMQGALALRYEVEPELDVVPAPPALRLIPGGPRLPDPQAWASKLVQAVAEVLAGDRPISQLVRFTDSIVFGELNRRVRLLGLTTTATARGLKERSAVRSVHVFTPATEVAEIAAHVRYGDRSRAIALRLEVHRGRWICTAHELGCPTTMSCPFGRRVLCSGFGSNLIGEGGVIPSATRSCVCRHVAATRAGVAFAGSIRGIDHVPFRGNE